MTTENWLTLLLTILGLYLGPKIAVHLALKQFHQQKLWEKKVEIYQQLIRDMSHLYSHFSDAEMSELMGYTAETGSPEIKEAQRTLERHSNAGGFIISPIAEKAIRNALTALSNPDYESPEVAYRAIVVALKDNLPILKECARQDCNISTP